MRTLAHTEVLGIGVEKWADSCLSGGFRRRCHFSCCSRLRLRDLIIMPFHPALSSITAGIGLLLFSLIGLKGARHYRW